MIIEVNSLFSFKQKVQRRKFIYATGSSCFLFGCCPFVHYWWSVFPTGKVLIAAVCVMRRVMTASYSDLHECEYSESHDHLGWYCVDCVRPPYNPIGLSSQHWFRCSLKLKSETAFKCQRLRCPKTPETKTGAELMTLKTKLKDKSKM